MNIVVYCSSQDRLEDRYQHLASVLGQWIGNQGHTLVYGGVKAGLMHIVAQATSDSGGHVIGVIPRLFAHRADPLNHEVVLTRDLCDRKSRMIEMGDAFVVLPGGIGTLDEWISTLSQLIVEQDTTTGIIVADLDGMFTPTMEQLQRIQATPFARGGRFDRSIVVHSAEQMIEQLEKLNKQ